MTVSFLRKEGKKRRFATGLAKKRKCTCESPLLPILPPLAPVIPSASEESPYIFFDIQYVYNNLSFYKMNLSNKVKAAEGVYKDLLESFLISNYHKNNLISHGLDHHRRVWEFAKELIYYTAEEHQNSDFIQKLIIACFLHDSGMSIDPGIRHGLHSKKLCEKFLNQNNLPKSDFPDVLHAIENHDDKDYKKSSGNDQLLTLLSVADDLDAFGYVGIYRYAEIYIVRGVDPILIGKKVRKNLKSRFENFCNIFSNYPEIIHKHEARFIETDNFFRNYSRQIQNCSFKPARPEGYYGIIVLISQIVNNTTTFEKVLSSPDKYRNDEIIHAFVKRLNEIKRSAI
jgi:HD superfamily phosphodiesterase